MVTHPEILAAFERDLLRRSVLSLQQRLDLQEEMYAMAVRFGHFKPGRELEGIEHDIQLAQALRSLAPETAS